MIYAFQDYDNLYLVMDLLSGGDLRYHLCTFDVFSESQTSKYSYNIYRVLYSLYNTWVRIYSQ